jgi:hypothetical protein
MIENETKRESRIELQTRLSHQHGQTKEDREKSSAFLALQAQKDLAVVRKSAEQILSHMNGLKGLDKVAGSRSLIRELQGCFEALKHIEDGCEDIMNLSKNKKLTIEKERRFRVNESQMERFETTKKLAREIQQNPNKKRRVERKEASAYKPSNEFMEMITRRKAVSKMKLAGSRKTVKKSSVIVAPQPVTRSTAAGMAPPTVVLKDGTEHVLPNPKKDDVLYTLAELVVHLRPFYQKGTKRMVEKLQKDKRILFSSSTFNRYLKKYIDDPNSLPDEDDFGERKQGPKPKNPSHTVRKNLNATEHASKSSVGNGSLDSKKVLTAKRKSTEKAEGMCIDSAKNEPRDLRIALYDGRATVFDPNNWNPGIEHRIIEF